MTTKVYECTPAFGWGAAGPAQSGIRREAAKLGLTLAPFPWRKLHELVAPLPVRVEGPPEAVAKFRDYMVRMGYDDRAQSTPQPPAPPADHS